MRRRGGALAIVALGTSWRRWVDIVEMFALRRPSRSLVGAQEYRMVHTELLEKCGSLAASANEVEAAVYRDIECLARPWLTPTILARAEHEILLDLLVRCRHAEQQLGGRRWARSIASWAMPALLISAVCFVILLGLGVVDRAGFAVLYRLRDWSDDLWFAVKHSTEVERLFFVGVILVIVSIVAVSRTAKS